MHIVLKRCMIACGVLFLLAGCATFGIEEKKVDYKRAKQTSTLEIPPDLSSPSGDDRFQLPQAASTSLSQYEAQREQTKGKSSLNVLPETPIAVLVRAGGQRWLSVRMSPEKLWPLLKIFWEENGFLLVIDDPAAGIMETDWAENRAKIPQGWLRSVIGKVLDPAFDAGERDKYRTRIEREPDGTTDVFITNRRAVEDYIDSCDTLQTAWELVPADPELEAYMLQKLLLAIGYDEKRAEAIVKAPGKSAAEDRAKIVQAQGGQEVLIMNDAFDRAWRRVGLALDRVGFNVTDRDRAQGMFYVRYVDPDTDLKGKKKGILQKLAFWQSDNSAKQAAELAEKAQYTVIVREAEGHSMLEVRDKDGSQPAPAAITDRILKLLYAQLK